jgi:ribonuclease D
VVELLKVLLKARSEDAGVAAKLIATVSDLEKIAMSDEAATPALKGWRRDVFGEDALRLKRGELALVLDGSRVKVVQAPARVLT